MVEREFLDAIIARTTEELEILRSQQTTAESRVNSSAEDLVRVTESYIAPLFSPLLPEVQMQSNLTLTTFFFKNYLNPPSAAPQVPDSPKSFRSKSPSSLFSRGDQSTSVASSMLLPPLVLGSKEGDTAMELSGSQTPKSSS